MLFGVEQLQKLMYEKQLLREMIRRTISIQDFVKAGAQVAATAREAVANADVIVSCLFDDKSCLDTAQGEYP